MIENGRMDRTPHRSGSDGGRSHRGHLHRQIQQSQHEGLLDVEKPGLCAVKCTSIIEPRLIKLANKHV